MKVIHDLTDSGFSDIPSSATEIHFLVQGNRLEAVHFETNTHKWIALKSVILNQNEISENSWIDFIKAGKDPSKVTATLLNSRFTLIPEQYFNPKLTTRYFALNFEREPTDTILEGDIKTISAKIVYALTPAENAVLSKINPDLKNHFTANFINCLTGELFSGKTFSVVHIADGLMLMAALKNNEFVFLNTFPFSVDEDILYHIANVSRQLGLKPEEDCYYFTGNLEKPSSRYDLLYTYIHDIRFTSLPDPYQLGNCFSGSDFTRYYHMFVSGICES